MAKKKSAPQAVDLPEESNGRYEAWFNPQWHTMLHCGVHGSLADAQTAVVDTIHEFVPMVFGKHNIDVSLDWQASGASEWLAFGSDGSPQETTLPLAKITRVG
jgi:predicted N-formylglutamate amidohydrolase